MRHVNKPCCRNFLHRRRKFQHGANFYSPGVSPSCPNINAHADAHAHTHVDLDAETDIDSYLHPVEISN